MTAIIFVLSNLTFPPKQGPHRQVVSLMKALRSRGYQISVLAHIRDLSLFDSESFSEWVGGFQTLTIIPTRLNYLLLTIRSLLPRIISPFYSVFSKMLKDEPKAILHMEGIGLAPLLAFTRGRPTLMSTVDAWSLRQTRLAKDEKGVKRLILRFYTSLSKFVERHFFAQASVVHVVSEVDAQWLRKSSPSMQIEVIPVALTELPVSRSSYAERLQPPVLVFWGDISHPGLRPGLEWLFDLVRPRLESAGLFAEWVIIGRREPDDALRIKCRGANFLGWVDDVDAVLRSADAVVLPDRNGTGLKNRTLHAMACGVPVIGTSLAFEGFPVTDGVEAMIRNSPEHFIEALLEVLASPEKANQISEAGRAFAVNGYGFDNVVSRWENIYQQISETAHGK